MSLSSAEIPASRTGRRVALTLAGAAWLGLGCQTSSGGAPTAGPENVASAPAAPPSTPPEAPKSAAPPATASEAPPPPASASASASASQSAPVASAEAPKDAQPKPAPKAAKLESLPRGKNGVLTAAEADRVLPAGQKPVLSLLDAGAAPRAKLLYDVPKGATYKGTMALDTAVKIEAAGKQLPESKMPRTSLTLDVVALDRNAAGDANVKGTVVEVSLMGDHPQLKQLSDAFALVKGLEMTYWVAPNGKTRDFDLKLPPTTPKEVGAMASGLASSFDQIVVPLPAEEVGVGGRWSTLARVSSNGIDILQLTKYKLAERSGSVIKLDVAVEQVAAKDQIVAPGMGGAKAKLLGFTSGGKGTVESDLHALGPKASVVSLDMKMELEASDGKGTTEKGTMTMKVGVEFKGK